MDEIALAKRRVVLYLALVAVFSGAADAVIIAAGKMSAGRGLYTMALMWTPAAAALVAARLTRKDPRTFGWSWSWAWALWAWALPAAYALAAYVPVWLSGLGRFPDAEKLDQIRTQFALGSMGNVPAIAVYAFFVATLGVVRSTAAALGEEIGWRGFLVPELARWMPFWKVSVVSGAVWTLYHVPILLLADYNAGTPWWWALANFAVQVIASSFIYAWARLRSGSVWPAAILHAAHNMLIQGFFTPLTADTGRTRWVVDEFGFALSLTIVLAAFAVVRPRAAPQPVEGQPEPRITP